MLDIILILALISALGTFALIPTRQPAPDVRTAAQRVADMLDAGHVAGIREMVVR